jgi:hypothetical protein
VAGVAAIGCHQPVQINPTPKIPMSSRWTATLDSPSNLAGVVQVHGSAWMAPPSTTDSSRTLIAIQISNTTQGGLHPWSVHHGNCGNDLGTFGSDRAYPPLRVDGDGTASATVTQTIPPPKTGDYFVEVLASPSNTGTIIACGNMAAPQD